jgi:two-component system response regulator YesN
MLRAVIVDDDITTLNGLKNSINWKRLNIEVVGMAKNGQEGLEIIETCQPDLILTDIYMPVIDGIEMLKILRQQNQTTEVVILSGYEDFKYAQSALKLKVLDYISKPATVEEIEAVLQAVAEKILMQSQVRKEEKDLRELLEYNLPWAKRQLFKELLEPGHVQSLYMSKVTEYLRIDLANCYFAVIVIQILQGGEGFHLNQNEWPMITVDVNKTVDEIVGSMKGVYIADVQLRMVTLIVSLPVKVKQEQVEQQAFVVAEKMVESIQKVQKFNVWAAIGSIVDTATLIHLSYKEAMSLIKEHFHLTDKKIITRKDISSKHRVLPHRTIESYHSMVEAAMQGQSEMLEQKLQQFLVELNTRNDMSIAILREFAIDFIGVLVVALHDHGLRIDDVNANYNPYMELERICSKGDLAFLVEEILLSVCQLMVKRAPIKHKKTIDFIIRFVHDHYAEDITLDIIANKVYLTRNYLSQIFKQATGENYNNYLTKVRMDKAKELMLSGNYKLYEISYRVGYKNNAYFSQLFKKHTGCNPSEFNQ